MNLRALSVTDACQQTGMPRSTIYALLESGQVAGNKVGAKWFVSAASLHAWINKTQAPAPAASKVFPEVEDRFA